MSEYVMYKELQDKLNVLIKENHILKDLISTLPDEYVEAMYKQTRNDEWRKIYEKRKNTKQ